MEKTILVLFLSILLAILAQETGIILFVDRQPLVRVFDNLQIRECKEHGYLDVFHGERVIAVCPFHLFSHHVCDKFQLRSATRIPIFRKSKIHIK